MSEERPMNPEHDNERPAMPPVVAEVVRNAPLVQDASVASGRPVNRVELAAPPVFNRTSASSAASGPDGDRVNVDVAGASRNADELSRSLLFRFFDGVAWFSSRLFGVVSMILLLAITASVPIAQFLCFGYLLEVTGRVARQGRLSDAMIGIDKASRLGSVLLGTWLVLIPVRFISLLWYEAYLIDPASAQTRFMWGLLLVAMVLAVIQIVAAWMCGGRLRYFFWQLFAPLSFGVWLFRRLANSRAIRPLLNQTIGRISPRVVNDLCRVRPPRDWFVPAILWRKAVDGSLYSSARDGLWSFVVGLRLPYYFRLGLTGFIGTFAWLFIPTMLLIAGTATADARAGLATFAGVVLAVPLFIVLPYLQVHFSRDGRLRRFLEVKTVLQYWCRAPLAHLVALLLALVFALPLFLLKIETIPTELLWLLSVVFVTFIWPSKLAIGLAYRGGSREGRRARIWWALPNLLLAVPVSFAFVVILFFTRYVTWHGAWSLLENHVFLLPAPFWL